MPVVEESLFHCRIGLQFLHRDAGTDICLHCPLPGNHCINGDVTHKNLRYRFKRTPPSCLIAYTAWYNVPLKHGEELASRLLDPDRPGTIDTYRAAVREASDGV